MRDNGKEDAVGCEITRKRTLGKGGGGRINDGGRSGGTLRYGQLARLSFHAVRVWFQDYGTRILGLGGLFRNNFGNSRW